MEANRSRLVGEINPSGPAETAPLGQSGVPVGLEVLLAVGMAPRVETTMDRGVDCGGRCQSKLLKRTNLAT